MILALLLLACSTPEPAESKAPEAIEAPTEVAPKAEAPAEAPKRVNLNTATKAELEAIPDMTPKMVHEFEEYRPYVSVKQFRKQIGKYVDADQITAWEPHVWVPVVYNDCDAVTLAQLPGLDEAKATTLMAGRPYADRDAFITALTEQTGAVNAQAGAELLK